MLRGTIYFIWVVFWLGWILAALTSKKIIITSWRRGIAVRVFLLALILFALPHHFHGNLNTSHDLALKIIGSLLFGLGLALAIWARVHLGRNWGPPMTIKAKPELITSGPYKFIRHPIYSGILLANLGTALAISYYWLIIMVVIGSYFIFSAFKEEKTMSKEFPSVYPKYMKTSKMLIPFIF